MKRGIFQHWIPLLQYVKDISKKDVTVCEIGTHKARSAIQIIRWLAENDVNVNYTGYDLFEMANATTDKLEHNGKGPGLIAYARSSINKLRLELGTKKVRFDLIMGYTKDTLPKKKWDFVFIDGGHSYETVKFDHGQVDQSKTVIFDDYQLRDVRKYFDEYVAENNITKVEWDFEKIKEAPKPCYALMNLPEGKHRKAEAQQRIGQVQDHQYPVIFR